MHPLITIRARFLPEAEPFYATTHSSGMDLCAVISEEQIIRKGTRVLVPTGLYVSIPDGYEAQVRPRSGLALRHGVTCLNSPGTIDSDYRGEIRVILINLGEEDFSIEPGMRIAQLIFAPVVQARLLSVELEELDDTGRGGGGFGSTGKSTR